MKDKLHTILLSPTLLAAFKYNLGIPRLETIEAVIEFTLQEELMPPHSPALAKYEGMKILDADLSTRAKNVLADYKVKTVAQLLQIEPARVMRWRSCGIKTALEIQEFMTSFELEKEEK